MKSFQKFIDFLLYGNFFIALCAAVQVRLTQTLFNIPFENLPIFVGVTTFLLYNLHKPITFFLKPQLVDNQRFLKTKRFSIPLSILTVSAFFLSLFYFFKLAFSTQILLTIAGIFSLGYVLPVWKKRRLRDLPFVKIFLIAFVWSLVVVGLPITEGGLFVKKMGLPSPFSEENSPLFYFLEKPTLLLLFLEKNLFIFAITLPFDIRDQDLDRQLGIKTIPLSMGEKRSRFLAWICLICCFSISCVLFQYTIYDFNKLFSVAITYFLSAIVIGLSQKNRSDYFFYGLVDGLLLLEVVVCFLIKS